MTDAATVAGPLTAADEVLTNGLAEAPSAAPAPESAPARRREPVRPRPAHAPANVQGSQSIREGERSRATLGRDALQRRMLAVADVAAAGLVLGAVLLAGGETPKPALAALLPLMVFVSKAVGLYDRDETLLRKTTLDEAPKLLEVATAYTLLAWLLDGWFVRGSLDKPEVVAVWGLLVVTMVTTRAVARRAALRLAPPERCLLLGDRAAAQRVDAKVATTPSLRAELVGRVPMVHEPASGGPWAPVGVLEDLDFVLRRDAIDRVIIAPPMGESSEDLLDTIRLVKALGVKVSVLPRLFEAVGSSVEFDDLGGLMLLGLHRYGLTKSSYALKRGLDLAGAVTALLLLGPLMAVIALAVKLTSPGPVLFRQHRVGRNGVTFDMLKFRTMRDGADAEKHALRDRNEGADGFFKIAADPRVTPVGRRLRRTSLDELPQLINVLRGEMSLVGPRPLIAEEDTRIEGWQRRRLDVTPGMTGVWQVLGSSRVPLADMVIVDYVYRANWSLWLDIKILLRTVPHVLRLRGL